MDPFPQHHEFPGLKKYHTDLLRDMTKYIDFRNKTVLEVGGCNLPRDLVLGILGAKKWVCVEQLKWLEFDRKTMPSERVFYPLNHPDSKQIIHDNDYIVFDGSATEIGKELHGEFDACVSFAAFEHFDDLPKAVDCIHRALKPNGLLCSSFGPIWSCNVGHHFWIEGSHFYHFNNIKGSHLPPFVHLLYSASEIDELLNPFYTTEEEIQIKNEIVDQVANKTRSQGLFYEDYLDIMKESRFGNVSVIPYWQNAVDETTWNKLCLRYPNYRSFNVNGVRIVAQK
jgi:SAM-dependent methyltransferase